MLTLDNISESASEAVLQLLPNWSGKVAHQLVLSQGNKHFVASIEATDDLARVSWRFFVNDCVGVVFDPETEKFSQLFIILSPFLADLVSLHGRLNLERSDKLAQAIAPLEALTLATVHPLSNSLAAVLVSG